MKRFWMLDSGYWIPPSHPASSTQNFFKFQLESIHYINLEFLIAIHCAIVLQVKFFLGQKFSNNSILWLGGEL